MGQSHHHLDHRAPEHRCHRQFHQLFFGLVHRCNVLLPRHRLQTLDVDCCWPRCLVHPIRHHSQCRRPHRNHHLLLKFIIYIVSVYQCQLTNIIHLCTHLFFYDITIRVIGVFIIDHIHWHRWVVDITFVDTYTEAL